jgi:hypothetical protein
VPYQFDFDPQNQIIRGRFTGRVTDDDVKEYYREAVELGKKLQVRAGVTDFSPADPVEISRKTVEQLAASTPALNDPKAVRVVIAPSPVAFGMARMFEIMGERTRPNLYIVRTEQEAWAILGVWEPKFKPLE